MSQVTSLRSRCRRRPGKGRTVGMATRDLVRLPCTAATRSTWSSRSTFQSPSSKEAARLRVRHLLIVVGCSGCCQSRSCCCRSRMPCRLTFFDLRIPLVPAQIDNYDLNFFPGHPGRVLKCNLARPQKGKADGSRANNNRAGAALLPAADCLCMMPVADASLSDPQSGRLRTGCRNTARMRPQTRSRRTVRSSRKPPRPRRRTRSSSRADP